MLPWEYTKINLNDALRQTEAFDLLNVSGEQGWEQIVSSPNNIAYLKRAIEEPLPRKTGYTGPHDTRKIAATTDK